MASRLLRAALALCVAASPAAAMGGRSRGGPAGPKGPQSVPQLARPEIGRQAGPALSGDSAIPSATVIQQAVEPGAAPAAPVTAVGQLQKMAGADQFAPAGSEKQGQAASLKFDGAEELEGSEQSEAGPAAAAQTPKLWFSGKKTRTALMKSQVYGVISAIKNEQGSRRYWEAFKAGQTVQVLSGMNEVFVSKIAYAATKTIGTLTRADFEGVYTKAQIRSRTLASLRRMTLENLQAAHDRSLTFRPGKKIVMTMDMPVGVVRIAPYSEARLLPENKPEIAATPIPRVPVQIPERLAQIHRYLPKAVVIDVRGMDRIPFPILEDISKLMKAGVYFILLSDKKVGEVDQMLTVGLTSAQRSQVTKYKLIIVGENGNSLANYEGNFPKWLPSRRFEAGERDIMAFAAKNLGATVVVNRPSELRFELKDGQEPGAFLDALRKNYKGYSVPKGGFEAAIGLSGGKNAIVLRPSALESSLPGVLEALRVHEGLFVNHSDLMVISGDEKVKKALPGSVEGADLETSMAALLGAYRVNEPGDFAASASKIQSFVYKRDGQGGSFYSIYMLTGHVMNQAFNWALWRYRETGVLPPFQEALEEARRKWEREDEERVRHLLDQSGYSMSDALVTMEMRLEQMYQQLDDLLKVYPIVLGTELPNLYVFDRYKKGQKAERDVLRMVYDLVVARQTPKGLEVMVADFKSGQGATNQTFDKDVQVQLYDLIPRLLWKNMTMPYGAAGQTVPVAKTGLTFIYPAETKQAQIHEGGRITFEKWLRSKMSAMRKKLLPPPAPKMKDVKLGKSDVVRVDSTRPKEGDFDTLELPQAVPGLKIKYQYAQMIVKGRKKTEYRSMNTQPKPFVAIIQTFTDQEPGRPAEVVAFARIEKVSRRNGQYDWHLSHVTPVKPYVVPNNKPGSVIWVKDVPVQGPKRLKK